MNSDVVERFLRYAKVDSQSNPNNEEVTPSSPLEFDMANVLADDLRELGCENVKVSEHAYVTATVNASEGKEDLPALGLCAHIDSSFDAPASNIKPQIVHYEGGDLVAGVVDGKEISTSPDQCSYLNDFVGQDIITSDGTTLLSADDKAGVAEIISLIARLKENSSIEHPTLKIAFVPDEEIGHGAELLDLDDFGASWCYTVDGGEVGEFNYECFNAAEAVVTVNGIMVHPGSAKNIMINAISVLNEFDRMLPANERPEHTEGYEGFFHQVAVEGSAMSAKATYIVRDHDSDTFAARQKMMLDIASFINDKYNKEIVKVELVQQYRNMAEKFGDCQFLIDNALEAYSDVDVVADVIAIRGGTDGAQLTFRGLPCPNIATGGCQFHSIYEFIPVSAMEKMVDVLERLVTKFAVEQK